MEKAYDLKELERRLKEAGLPEIEDLAQKVYEATKGWTIDSAKLSPNPYDDLGIPFFRYADDLVLPQIDKIDGKEG